MQNLTPEQIIENHNNRQYETSIFYLEANNAGGTDYLWDGLKFRDDCDYYFFCATEDVYPPNFKNSSNIVFGTRGKNPSFPVFLKSFCENLATVKVTGDVAASGFAEAGSGAAGGP